MAVHAAYASLEEEGEEEDILGPINIRAARAQRLQCKVIEYSKSHGRISLSTWDVQPSTDPFWDGPTHHSLKI
jgi:hypothetical protein